MLVLLLSTAVGLSLGLLGGGGSILAVPMLVYAAGLEPKNAIASSLFVVGATSAAAMLAHASAGRVAWRVGALFGLSSMLGAYGGARLAHALPARALLAGFTLMMFIAGAAMMRRRSEPDSSTGPTAAAAHGGSSLVRASGVGVAIGMITGMVGAGGGFVIVPALVMLSKLPMRVAVGTSLLVIAMNSFAGFAGALGHVNVDWRLIGPVAGVSVAASLVGVALAGKIKPASLRVAFAWFVLGVAVFMTTAQLPKPRRVSATAPDGFVLLGH